MASCPNQSQTLHLNWELKQADCTLTVMWRILFCKVTLLKRPFNILQVVIPTLPCCIKHSGDKVHMNSIEKKKNKGLHESAILKWHAPKRRFAAIWSDSKYCFFLIQMSSTVFPERLLDLLWIVHEEDNTHSWNLAYTFLLSKYQDSLLGY